MAHILIYTFLSVIIVSLISLIGVVALPIKAKKLNRLLIYLISFSAGAILGDTFIHLLPEISDSFSISKSIFILAGILIFFILEKFIHWHHCHPESIASHTPVLAYTNLFGDALHNLIDGLIIAASYMASIPTGIATTVAVCLHEIPQEIGEFGVLIHSGFSKTKALLMNLASASLAIIGSLIGLVLSNLIENVTSILIPITIGSFIYIAGSDLIPEIHKETNVKRSIIQFISLIAGILVMFLLLFLE